MSKKKPTPQEFSYEELLQKFRRAVSLLDHLYDLGDIYERDNEDQDDPVDDDESSGPIRRDIDRFEEDVQNFSKYAQSLGKSSQETDLGAALAVCRAANEELLRERSKLRLELRSAEKKLSTLRGSHDKLRERIRGFVGAFNELQGVAGPKK